MKRVQINTQDLPIGEAFYGSETSSIRYVVIAQGPEVYGYKTPHTINISRHADVWVDAPPTTIGDFKVGECFMKGGVIYEVSAVGRVTSIATYRGGVKDEFWFYIVTRLRRLNRLWRS